MYATIRWYTTNPELADALTKNRAEVEKAMRQVPGLTGYYLVNTPGGVVSLTVCESQSGTEESSRAASEWMRQNLSGLSGTTPKILSGDVIASVAGTVPAR